MDLKAQSFNRAISRVLVRWDPVRTVYCSDTLFLWSLFDADPIRGWHSRRSDHNVLFLDGHAAAITVSADDFERPPGWTGWYPKRGRDYAEYNDRSALRQLSFSLAQYGDAATAAVGSIGRPPMSPIRDEPRFGAGQ